MNKPKSKKKNWLLYLLLLLTLILIGYGIYKSKKKPKGIPVELHQVTKRTIIEKVSASGKIFPEKEVKISSDVSGEIVALLIAEGDSVVMGQVLLKIDPEAYESAVERGKATVNNARAQISISEAQIESSEAQRSQILAQLENAKAIHQRNKDLLKDGVISTAEFDQSLSSLKSLEANLNAANASYKSAQKSVEAAQYQVKSAEASLKEISTNLSRTTIKAPTSGIISSLSVEKGERVVGTMQMTGTEIMRIANMNEMEVQVEVSENDILRVSLADEVQIEVDAYLDKKFYGKVTEIANSAANISSIAGISLNSDQVTNFIVKIRINHADTQSSSGNYTFRPGMSASVEIKTNEIKDQLAVPIQAVTVRAQENKEEDIKEILEEVVFVATEADTVKKVVVNTGIQDDDYIAIKSGLDSDKKIVIGPYAAISKKLKEGDKIREKEEKKQKY